MKDTLYIVVPCYNEEETLPETAARLREKLTILEHEGKIARDSKVVFVDDGSSDETWNIIKELRRDDDRFAGLSLSRNRGHQHALLAGLMTARLEADMVISMDADLQDDIDAIDKMLAEYLDGADIVLGVRSKRSRDSFFKRFTAGLYYSLLRALGCDIIPNHADFRLMNARSLEALSDYREQDIFLRGVVPMLGYRTAVVEYERGARFAGKTKYPLKKMLSLALRGITGLSLRPLRLISLTGGLMLLIALGLIIYSIVSLAKGETILDWKLPTVSLWLVGGIITLSLGVVGEYVGRAYMESKRRPRYFIDKAIGITSCEDGFSDVEGMN